MVTKPTHRKVRDVWGTLIVSGTRRYMHRNPVTRGLAAAPADWRWSSYRFYFLDEPGPVRVNEGWGKISFSAPAA